MLSKREDPAGPWMPNILASWINWMDLDRTVLNLDLEMDWTTSELVDTNWTFSVLDLDSDPVLDMSVAMDTSLSLS
jgi:hypothetical protein